MKRPEIAIYIANVIAEKLSLSDASSEILKNCLMKTHKAKLQTISNELDKFKTHEPTETPVEPPVSPTTNVPPNSDPSVAV